MLYKNLESYYYKNREEYEEQYKKRFESVSTQKLDFFIKEYQAFYVNTNEIIQLIYDIMQANRRLDDICVCLPGVALTQYKRNKLIDEINITNEIEGVYSTKREISDILDNATRRNRFEKLRKYTKTVRRDCIARSSCRMSGKCA